MSPAAFCWVALLLACGSLWAHAQDGMTLARVRARGVLWCGVDRSEAEYSSTDEHGNRSTFDLDLCKAVAVAALGPGAAVKATFYADDATSMQALADGKADVVASLSVDAERRPWHKEKAALGFSKPVLYDAVGLMVSRAGGVQRVSELAGKKICFLTETHVEERLQAWFAGHHLDLLPFPFQEEGELEAAFATGNCAALGGDLTRIAETRANMGARAHDYIILPETLGEDTLALAYRLDDSRWGQLADWTLQILLHKPAPEPSALAATPGPVANATNVSCQPGQETATATSPQLPGTRAGEIIAAVGTYSALFERDLGAGSQLHLPLRTSAASPRPCSATPE